MVRYVDILGDEGSGIELLHRRLRTSCRSGEVVVSEIGLFKILFISLAGRIRLKYSNNPVMK